MTTAPAALPEGCTLVHLEEVDGTNAEAMRRVMAGDRGPAWIVADRQTAGRGRSGRPWHSLPGNLFASYVAALACPPAKAGQLSLVAGVAVFEALSRVGAPDGLRLKWPNDILVGAEKVGGILVESSSRPGEGIVAVIGIGLNLVSAPDDIEQSATFLARHGLSLSPREALCFLAQAMKEWIDIWDGGAGFERVREAWLQRAGAIGEPLVVNAGTGPVAGAFAGIDESGALLLADASGNWRSFAFGDVTLPAKDVSA